jgi:hypothetical protein
MGKVIVLVVGVFLLGGLVAPAGAYTFTSSYYASPYGTYYNGMPYETPLGDLGGTDLSSIYGPFGPFGLDGLGGFGGLGDMGDLSSGLGYMPYDMGLTGTPLSTDLGQVSSGDLFSNLGTNSLFNNGFGTDLFQTQTYGPPPTDNITKTLVGQLLSYSDGTSSFPLEYQVESSDIGNITGTQYDGQNAWDVRVGQNGMYWDVILDSTGNTILAENQVQ